MEPGVLLAGKYRLLRLIGEGGMGAVWAATNELSHRNFALKLIAGEKVPSKEARARLLREARVCGGLKHRNVVELYDVGLTEEGIPFLVMELLRGESLEQSLERGGRLRPETAAGITMAIARGLRAAHGAGIVHRDLKPANVFLHEEPEVGTVVKILDFGVSRVMAGNEVRRTAPGVTVGSPAYMSPEQATGAASLDHRTNLWALGVVLFEMLSGTLPFEGSNEYAVLTEIVRGRIPSVAEFASEVDPRLVAIVERCLQRSVSDRVGSADEIISALEAMIARSDVLSVRPAALLAPLVPPTETRRGMAAPASDAPGKAPALLHSAPPSDGLASGATLIHSAPPSDAPGRGAMVIHSAPASDAPGSAPAVVQSAVGVGSEGALTVMHLPPVVETPGPPGQLGSVRWRRVAGAAAIVAAAVGIALLALGWSTSGVAGHPVTVPAEAATSGAAAAAPVTVRSPVLDATTSASASASVAPPSVASGVPSASSRPTPPGGKLARPPAVAADAGPARARPTTFDDPG